MIVNLDVESLPFNRMCIIISWKHTWKKYGLVEESEKIIFGLSFLKMVSALSRRTIAQEMKALVKKFYLKSTRKT